MIDIADTEQKRFLSLLEIVQREGIWLLKTVVEWLDVRNLRNKLIHEYMADAEEFALALNSAHVFVQLLVAVYNAINIFASSRIAAADWPKLLPAHNNQNRNDA